MNKIRVSTEDLFRKIGVLVIENDALRDEIEALRQEIERLTNGESEPKSDGEK